MDNIKIQLFTLVLLLPLFLSAQSKIDYLEFPKNSISVAPANIFFDGNGNTMFYKRLISRSEARLKYLRIGTDFYSAFKKGDDSGTKNYSLNLGIEHLKKLDNFSLSFGYEGAFDYYSTDNRHAEPSANSIFFPQSSSLGSSSNSDIDRGTFFLYSVIGFIGIKYHLSKHFALGLESAVGFGFYTSIDKMNDGSEESTTGFLNDIDPSRHFTIEYYF